MYRFCDLFVSLYGFALPRCRCSYTCLQSPDLPLYLGTRFDYYYVGLLFGALASTVCGYLWFKSRYIPRALAAFGVITSAFCVACTFVFYIFPNFDKIVNLWWFD